MCHLKHYTAGRNENKGTKVKTSVLVISNVSKVNNRRVKGQKVIGH